MYFRWRLCKHWPCSVVKMLGLLSARGKVKVNILITGGTGLIGRALCKYWRKIKQPEGMVRHAAQNHIWVLSREPEKVSKLCGKKVVGIGSLKELDGQNIQVVINLAGAPIADKAWTDKRKIQLEDSRVLFTHRLVAWMGTLPTPPRVFISGSAMGYYGDCGDEVIDDYLNKPQQDFASQLCHKWEVEAFQALLSDIRIVCLRTGIVLACEGGFLSRVLPVFKMGLGGALGSGKQWMPWIHLNDVVRMIDFFVQTWETAGSYNVCAPEPVTNKQFTKAMARAVRRPALFKVPVWALDRKYGKELTDMILSSQRAVPKRVLEAGFQFEFPDLDDALDDLLSSRG